MKLMIPLFTAALVAAPGAARADDDAEARRKLTSHATSVFLMFVRDLESVAEIGGRASMRESEECVDFIKTFEQKGLRANDLLVDRLFAIHPGEAGGAKSVDGYNYSLPFDRVVLICDRHAVVRKTLEATRPLSDHMNLARDRSRTTMDDVDAGFAQRMIEKGDQCMAAAQEAAQSGADVDMPIQGREGGTIVIRTFAEEHCQPALDWGNEWKDTLPAYLEAKHEALIAPYVKAGIKGDRLDLFLEKGNGLMLAGCDEFIPESPKKLAKLKAAFLWLTDSYGYITVRKYKFKGNTYKTTEKTFDRAADAYRACK